MSQELRQEIRSQAHKISKDCDRASIRDSLISASWYKLNLWLGLASAVLAGTIASFAGADLKGLTIINESSGKLIVAVLASSSAILTSVLTFLAPSEKANIYHEYSNRYWALRDQIRKFVRIECISAADIKHLKREYEKLLQERIELDKKHPLVPEWVYNEAGKKLEQKKKRNAGGENDDDLVSLERHGERPTNVSVVSDETSGTGSAPLRTVGS